ncbi:hypothetical protein GCM10010420_15500 [Streptomyces glaucosporus]|uniref:Uncharacterized protein n=1 Tax=Streptomyces glaucosporus TaxID=284044 RepID=A0ABN3I0U3_9ACTN
MWRDFRPGLLGEPSVGRGPDVPKDARLLEQSGVGCVPAVHKSQLIVGCPRIEGLFAQAPARHGRRSPAASAALAPPGLGLRRRGRPARQVRPASLTSSAT